jgi:cytochrome P450
MPYMEAIVLESVRMFMGRTFSIPHRALRDTELQGYHIPKVSSKLFKSIMQVKMLKTR